MKLIHLPHKVADYACPINGIEDQYEWKTGVRLPGYFLMDLSMIGFTMIKMKTAPAPRMVCWGMKTGKTQHEFLSDIMGYRWTWSEGTGYKSAWSRVKESVDRGVPALIGLLDMYHLPYFEKMYHRVHIPQHYVLMVGYDDAQQLAYVQDNSRQEVQAVPYSDLREAWNVHNPGQGIKNTYAILEFNENPAGYEQIVRNGLTKRAKMFLDPQLSFMGIKGMRKLADEFAGWPAVLSEQQLQDSIRFLVTFTCSVVPMLPQRMLPFKLDQADPHQATRDRFAAELVQLAGQFHQPEWSQAAVHFKRSGDRIQELTDCCVDYLMQSTSPFVDGSKILQGIVSEEEQAFKGLAQPG
jgi:hypothetical protein